MKGNILECTTAGKTMNDVIIVSVQIEESGVSTVYTNDITTVIFVCKNHIIFYDHFRYV